MIRAHKISFHKLMSAGFISADTYRFLLPKERLYELNVIEINRYEKKYKSELLPLFYDEETHHAIVYMEELDSQIMAGDDTPYVFLNYCLKESSIELEHLVDKIGKKAFLQEYVYCTEESLKTKYLISDENIFSVILLRYKFRSLFKLYYSGLDIDECKSYLARTSLPVLMEDASDQNAEGDEFYTTVIIDDDAVSFSNIGCKKYVEFLYSLDKNQLNTVVSFFISLLKKIPTRTWNGIKNIGYREFLVNYLFADPIKLLKLRNFGRKSLYEFEKIKPSIVDFIKELYLGCDVEHVEDSLKQEEEALKIKKSTLKERVGENQYKLVTGLLENFLKVVSVRSRNCIMAYNGDFIEDFVCKGNDIKSIKNLGRKSEKEILPIIRELRELIDSLEERELSEDELRIFEKQLYYNDFFDEFAHDYFLRNGHLPMFYLLERFFRSLLATSRDFRIYNLLTPVFKDEEKLTLEEVANRFNLSRERVRQIYMKFKKHLYQVDDTYQFHEHFSIATFVNNSNDWEYAIDKFRSNISIDSSMLSGCFDQENHHFTNDFILFLIGAVVRKQFVPIGKPILPYPIKSDAKWNNCYLIKKDLTDKFDFIKFFELIEEYEESNTEDLEVSVREMIIDTFFSAWNDFDSSVVEEISDVVCNLLIQELGIIPDDQFHFIIEGKKEENVADIIYDILKSNGDPLSCEELFQSIDGIYPHKYKSPASLKTLVGRDLRLCLVGGNNLVALIEWEHVKIGSIRSIIVQYLEEFDEPQPIKEIVSYVQSYRDTSDSSIRSTMGSGEQFVQFDGGYYGLSWKHYPELFYLDESDRVFHKRVQELEQFLQTHNHFPFASSDPQEQVLHQWWIQIKSYIRLSEYERNEVKRIENKYRTLARKKKHLRWFDNCRQYYEFFQEHHRKPSKTIPEEQELYLWFQMAAEDFTNGTLTLQQEMCYLDLCKSL